MAGLGLELVQNVVQEETENYVGKLLAQEQSRHGTTEDPYEQAKCAGIKRLAGNMADSLCKRLVENKDAWILERDGRKQARSRPTPSTSQGSDAGVRSTPEEGAAAAAAKRQRLQAVLDEKIAEQEQITAKILGRLKERDDKQMNLLEIKFAKVREDMKDGGALPANVASMEAKKIHEDYATCSRIRKNIAVAKASMARIAKKREDLEKMNQQQMMTHDTDNRYQATSLDLDCDEENSSDAGSFDEEMSELRRRVEVEEENRSRTGRPSQGR